MTEGLDCIEELVAIQIAHSGQQRDEAVMSVCHFLNQLTQLIENTIDYDKSR